MTPETDTYSPENIIQLNNFVHLVSLLEQNYDVDTASKILKPVLEDLESHPSVKALLLAATTTVKLQSLSIRERDIEFREKNLEMRSQLLSLKEEVVSLKEERAQLKSQLKEINTEEKS